MLDLKLHRNALGHLVFIGEDGFAHENVAPVHAFPISAPMEGIALISADGHELVWINQLSDVSESAGTLLQEELSNREFIPEIKHLLQVSSFATPSTWSVDTDRGETNFVLKGEDDIRRLGASTLLIADSHGIHFLIRDFSQLDTASRKLLDRFL